MGVLGGIIAGLIVYKLHNRFYTVQLPDSFAFFSGARFVPIITSLVMAFVGLVIPLFGHFCANDYGDWPTYPTFWYFWAFSVWFRERLLLPFGLHHILVSMIRFTEAGVQLVAGKKCLVR